MQGWQQLYYFFLAKLITSMCFHSRGLCCSPRIMPIACVCEIIWNGEWNLLRSLDPQAPLVHDLIMALEGSRQDTIVPYFVVELLLSPYPRHGTLLDRGSLKLSNINLFGLLTIFQECHLPRGLHFRINYQLEPVLRDVWMMTLVIVVRLALRREFILFFFTTPSLESWWVGSCHSWPPSINSYLVVGLWLLGF